MFRLVAVCIGDVAEVDVERRAGLDHVVRRLERRRERADARRVHVREVEDRANEVDLSGDREHVVDAPEVADPAHHLDPERHEPVLGDEALAEIAELVDHVGNRALALAPEQEAGVEDDQLGAGGLREPGRVVEHAERHLELLLARDVAHERGERGVDREGDVVRMQRGGEVGGGVIVEPEAADEADLARPVAALRKSLRCILERAGVRQPGRPDPDLSHGPQTSPSDPISTVFAMANHPSRIDLLELDIDLRLTDLWREAAEISEWNLDVVAAFMRAAYGKGYCDALTEESPGSLCHDHGYRVPGRRVTAGEH